MALNLKIIVGSTRPGRQGLPVARWVEQFAKDYDKFDVELVDLAEIALPILDEAGHPRMQKYEHEHTKRWSKIVGSADAFVFVTPEYDYFVPASLVNAVQYLFNEWSEKPAGVVSYGGVSGGLRSTQELRLLLSNVNVVALPATVPIPFFNKQINEAKVFEPSDPTVSGTKHMFDQLYRWAVGLKRMREGTAE